MTTVNEVKKAGWLEVEELQKELSKEKQLYGGLDQIEMLSHTGNQMREKINTTIGRIQGMVHILNMLK